MARKKVKKSEAVIAYEKQEKRIKNFIRKAEKRGYRFSEKAVPDRPKRITKASVRKLAKIKPQDLYKHAIYGGEATYGEIVKGLEGLKEERKATAHKAAETRKKRRAKQGQTNTSGFEPLENISEDLRFFDRVVMSNWYGTLDMFRDGEAYGLLRAWMNTLIRDNGEHNTAVMIQDAAEQGYLLTWEVVYKIDIAMIYIGHMLDFLPDQGVMYKDEMYDKMDFWKAMGDALEEYEDWERPF